MDRSEGWEQDAPARRPWTQGPWHGDPADQGSSSRGRSYGDPADQGAWQQGPWQQDPWNDGAGFGDRVSGFGDGVYGDLAAATVAARTLARRLLRFLLLFVAGGFAVGAGLIALAVAAWPHTALAVLLVLLAVPVLFVTLVTAAAVWVGRRAWRSGAWMEAVPEAAGAPWLSRVIWAIRAALAGKAFWRLGRRGRRSTYQARAGDLSGTTR
jgi:hypothetical protein